MPSLINAASSLFEPSAGSDPGLDRASLLNGSSALAAPPTQADAWDATSKAYGDWVEQQRQAAAAQQKVEMTNGMRDPTTGDLTDRGWGQQVFNMAMGIALGTAAPEMKGGVPVPRLAKYEVVPGETDWGHQYEVHVNPPPGRLQQLLEQSASQDGSSLRVLPGSADVAVADASKAIHSHMQMALMDADHPMLGQLDPEGAERLGWVLQGTRGDPVPGTVRLGDWNLHVESPTSPGKEPDIVPPSQWPEALRRAVGLKPGDPDPGGVAATQAEPPGFTAYHGSPHSFDQFDLSKIGTGEGAQAYGHGLYFADREAIARGYRDRLTQDRGSMDYLDPNGARVSYSDLLTRASKAVDAIPGATPDIKRAIPQQVIDAMEDGTNPVSFMSEYETDPKYQAHYQAAADAIKGFEYSKNPGSMYKVQINADPAQFLDWDKPRDQQPANVQAFARENYPAAWDKAADGSSLYQQMVKQVQSEYPGATKGYAPPPGFNAHAIVTQEMAQAGIPGIRYLDGGSRSDGSGTSNHVIFDPATIAIIRKYGIAGLMAGGAAGAGAQRADAQSAAADPYDYTNRYNTQLSPADEAAYQRWGKQQAAQSGRNPAADTYDYDMRGFWKSGQDFADNGHAGDQFKKPNHPTFSTFSQYHGIDGNQGGTWGGGRNGQPWTFTPGATNLQMHDLGDLQRYFNEVESGNRLILPQRAPSQ